MIVREARGGTLALTFVLGIALALRLAGLRYGLPAVYNPDEVSIMSRALAFAKGDLNPHNFLYPTLYFYVLFAWEGLTAAAAVGVRVVDSFAAFQREFFVDPTRVYVAGRLLTAVIGTATVAATFALARRIAGPVAGLTAAVAVAVSPLHVRDSHYVKHDVPVTLLIVLAYLAYERLWRVFPGRTGVFEEVRTVMPAPGTTTDWTHLRVFRLKNAAAAEAMAAGLDAATARVVPDEARRKANTERAATLRDLVRREVWHELK